MRTRRRYKYSGKRIGLRKPLPTCGYTVPEEMDRPLVGAEAGAWGGAAIGTAIAPGIGTAIGGVVGGFIGGIAGAFGGSQLGKWTSGFFK